MILSIKPKYANAIIDGSKLYEYRKVLPKNTDFQKIYIYASKPIMAIIGEFTIGSIISDTPQKVWELTQKDGGITRSQFFSYFNGRDTAHAIKIDKVIKYFIPIDPKTIFKGFTAPQNFIYIEDNEELKREARTAKKIEKANKQFLSDLAELKKSAKGFLRDFIEKTEKDLLDGNL